MLGMGVLDSQTEEAEEMARGVAVGAFGLGHWRFSNNWDTSKTHQLVIHNQSSEPFDSPKKNLNMGIFSPRL